jgi:acetyltransferase-like isoleucine patch superfamily enzyme
MIKKIIDSILFRANRRQCKRWTYLKSGIFYSTAKVVNCSLKPEQIKIGINAHIQGELLVFAYGGSIEIGNNCFVGENSRIWSGEKIVIGSHVLISHNVNIIDTNSHELDHMLRAQGFKKLIEEGHPKEKESILTAPIIIEDYAWISFNVVILKGVKIGKGAIIGAGSVVTKDVEEFTFVAGNPAKFVKYLDQKTSQPA